MTASGRWKRWWKFNAVGAIGICVQLAALALFRSVFKIEYLIATALAVEITILHNFIWHERFTWSDRKAADRMQRLVKFNLTTGAFSIAGNLFFTGLLVEAGIPYVVPNAIAIACCSAVNFFLNDRLVFVTGFD